MAEPLATEKTPGPGDTPVTYQTLCFDAFLRVRMGRKVVFAFASQS